MGYEWRNRIVGHSEADPAALIDNDKNFRLHKRAQREALAGAIHEVGFTRSVTVNRRTGRIIDGHLRVALARQQKQRAIPVEWVDLTEQEEAQALATMDPIAAMAETDEAALADLLAGVETSQVALVALFDSIRPTDAVPAAEAALPVEGVYDTPVGSRLVVLDKGEKVAVTEDELNGLRAALAAHRARHKSESGFFAHLLARAAR